ncbi:gliding motility-associated protein GldM [Parabacteroides sp. PFB2-12]|uniref:type IX secretion system motor protein PorM/GldM n=1 Tax=unclassified Parabacteroides TaxID=2649774 RepID=UPI0024757FBC|nr:MULTISPECIES: gliding motility protein GldM [unclassified Parabacteroides]MDH6341368.1 gliding motility-associated protein GldM [Parabacteroides sp. PM6-13]MDH6389162.1 gliding motility-associated protein GldM [Parabacteroides sp. PFB2-12]
MAIGNNPNSPRQKMINLMYLVFIAMMALNVSSEVLNGFELVEDSLRTTINNASNRNVMVSQEMDTYYNINPEKAGDSYAKKNQVKQAADSLFNYIQDLKEAIVKTADGKNGDVTNIDKKDDLEAASRVMLAPVVGEGKRLRESIDAYRALLTSLVDDPAKTELIESTLNTNPPQKAGLNIRTWEEAMFESMPTAAAITILTKLQSDVLYAEGEMLSYLLSSVDVGDYRVNHITAQVIPESQIVMRGNNYRANIVLSAVDTTKRPTVFVNGAELPVENKGLFTMNTSATGTFPVKGYIEMPNSDGSILRREFESEYYVTEPNATVAPTMMNVMYAGIENPVRIAVPGVPSGNVSATMTNGRLTGSGNNWVATPSTVGTEAVITVNARMADGRLAEMAKTTFRVRALPDPMPYIEYKDANGAPRKFRGGRIAKRDLLQAGGIMAAIDDDIINQPFTVLRFTVTYPDSFGNMVRSATEGSTFSADQRSKISEFARGKSFFITGVVAKGPDGIERPISPLEIIVN